MDLEREFGRALEAYSFPVEDVDDAEVVKKFALEQPLPTIEFKAPQLLVYHFGLTHPRFVMSFDKGMGKTIAYLATLYEAEPGKVVIVCGNNAKLAQRREILRHLERWKKSFVFIQGNRDQRKRAWNEEADVYIVTAATLVTDMGLRARAAGRIAPSWVDDVSTHMAFDEWHKYLRNKTSGVFKALKGFKNKRMIFASGSAGGKGVHSLWAVLYLCDPIKFSSYWKYVMKHAIVEETYFGKKISGCKNIKRWRAEVAPYVFHRRKDLKDYPSKTRQLLEVEMEPWQRKLHDQLKKELIAELPDGEFIAKSNVLAMTSTLRQMLICPKMMSRDLGWGAGLEGIYEDFAESELNHTVVSVPFIKPIPLVKEFFASKGVKTFVIQGGMGHEEIGEEIAAWTSAGGVMIQSIMFAESYELPAARTMYMLGYVHDPEQNMQAEDRIHRDKRVTPHPVDIYYVKNVGAYDEDILDALAENADNIHDLMHRPLKEVFRD